ncbi:hypothetical protein CARUB_v10010991mg [Capsella rubella]|uniref:F-box domain-containing protein n=1 Tax=Capsella rubella TaxID=81985 RepID=R0I4U1_9BRAS|nr:hypothetical protein CARUB_v10010991mg [Capsella rubella]
MKNNMEQKFSEDLLIRPSSSSKLVRKHSVSIPVDLLIDILVRVPAKSVARFRCVSKLWGSILVRHDFTERFMSVASPRLLFISIDKGESFLFSSPQPQNPDDNSTLVATPCKSYPKYLSSEITDGINAQVVRGLVFLQRWRRKARKVFFGFDPISKQFKVLCMTWSRYGTPNTHRIMTLETRKRLWRTIQDPILPHDSVYGNICINGVLYYRAEFSDECSKMVCFDFRFEKFSLIEYDKDMEPQKRLDLFNYKGKLGAYEDMHFSSKGIFALWVLEDGGKHIWSKRICVLPPSCGNIVSHCYCVGMTSTGEVVFSPYAGYESNPFCIFYYNIERNTVTRIYIQGFEERLNCFNFVHTFLDQLDNIKVM